MLSELSKKGPYNVGGTRVPANALQAPVIRSFLIRYLDAEFRRRYLTD